VAHNRAPNPGDIPSQKAHPRLLQRVIALLGLPQRRINLINRRLKGRKLDHRIRDLPPPQRLQPLIQPADPLLLRHLPPPFPQRARVGG